MSVLFFVASYVLVFFAPTLVLFVPQAESGNQMSRSGVGKNLVSMVVSALLVFVRILHSLVLFVPQAESDAVQWEQRAYIGDESGECGCVSALFLVIVRSCFLCHPLLLSLPHRPNRT